MGEISIPDQVNRIEAFISQKKLSLIETYTDRGRTATNDRRPEFQRMIADIESGRTRPKYIIAYDQSRLFRNGADLARYEKRLAKLGVRFVTTTQNFGKSVSGVMSKKFIAGVDEYIPMITSVRVKEAQLALARQGFFPGGGTCYGIEAYVVERFGKKVRRKLRPKPGEREVVQKIFEISLHGDADLGPSGIVKIAEWLDINGIRTRKGKKFVADSVYRILTNPSYTGKYLWNCEAIERDFVDGDEDKEIFEFELEPIVDKDTFERVQLKMASQAPGKCSDTWVYRGSLLLRELAYCTCGGRLGLATGTGNDGEQRRYYLCNRKKKVGRHECSASRVNEVVLDQIVLEALKETLLDDQRLGGLLRAWTERDALQYAKRAKAGASVQARSDRADRELRSMINLAKVDPDLAADDVFMKEMSAARREAVVARNELAALGTHGTRPDEITPEQIAIFGSMVRNILDGSDKREIKAYLRSIISRIEVGDSQIKILGDQDTLTALVGENPRLSPDEDEGHRRSEVRTSIGKWRSRQDSNL